MTRGTPASANARSSFAPRRTIPPNSPARFLRGIRVVSGHVDEKRERHPERVAQPHQTGRLLSRVRVEAAAQPQRIIGVDAHDRSAQPAEADERSTPIFSCSSSPNPGPLCMLQQAADEDLHVVRALLALRQQREGSSTAPTAEASNGPVSVR